MKVRRNIALAAIVLALASFAVVARAQEPSNGSSHQADVAEIGSKLSNPVSDVWALFTEFDAFCSDGNVRRRCQ